MTSASQPLQVSQLTQIIKDLLEQNLNSVILEGEISNFRPAASGHIYFTLKDSHSMINAVLFRSAAVRIPFHPKDGDLVRVRGRVSVYPPRGAYQIICETMTMAGEGKILAMLEERKRIFAAQGLFDQANKKEIPLFPRSVAVITSPTGAAIRDIQRVFKSRIDRLHMIVVPAVVQGAAAGPELAKRIAQVNRMDLADLIILGRGGGSLEDLLPFSEEVVVKAVAESRIPVISAVGHEIDWALSDFAADYRGATPSAAAEKAIQGWITYQERFDTALEDMRYFIQAKIDHLKQMTRLFNPREIQYSFRQYLQPKEQQVDEARDTLIRNMQELVESKKNWLALRKTQLEGFDPKKILSRGYAIVRDKNNKILLTPKNLSKEDRIKIEMKQGVLDAVVEGIDEEKHL